MVTGPAHWELLQRARAMDNNGEEKIYFSIFLFPNSSFIFTHHYIVPLFFPFLCTVFCAACSPARDESPDAVYTAWGHSTLVSPWGKVMEKAGYTEDVIVADIDLHECEDVRSSIPCWKQKRMDIYELRTK